MNGLLLLLVIASLMPAISALRLLCCPPHDVARLRA